MKKIILTGIAIALIMYSLTAQERRKPNPEMFEKIKAEKVSFFTGKLDLTSSEAQAFWPVYYEFDKKRFEIQRQKHQFERMPDEEFNKLSESDIEKLTNEYIGSYEKEALLLKEYNKLFLKILPKKKLLLMYRTENEFRSHLIREFRRNQGDKK
jgi:hypothetical protein